MRSFLRDRPAEPALDDFEDREEFLATKYSLPTWLVRQWSATFGEQVEAICAGVNEPARASVTANTIKASRDDVAETFARDGVTAVPSAFALDSLAVSDAGYARRHESAAKGVWWIQSESSAMPADILNPQPEEATLDVCSGRGNKALQLGARMESTGSLLCIEIDEKKAATLQHRLAGAGMSAAVITGDATLALLQPSQRFDRVLVDAPCSGLGIVGRHPEARWKKQPGDGERLARTQVAILDRIAPAVHEGGALVYAVCSTDPRETIEVVEWLRRHHNFERGLIPARYESLLTDEGDVRVPPGIDGRDGFFIARLERR